MTRCAVVPYEGSEDYLFISYSHKDAKIAIPIMEQLMKEGYRIWYDEGIDPGSEWPENIASHLGGASACVGLISNNYLASDNCRREMNFALKRQIPYLSVMLEKVEMSAGVEMQLSANQAIFKYMLPSNDLFLQKINSTGILRSARALPTQAEARPEQKAEPEKKPIPAKPPKVRPEKPPKARPEEAKSGSKKNLRLALILAAALAVVAAAVVGIILSKSGGGKKPADPDKTLHSGTAAPETTEPKTTVPKATEPASTEPETAEPASTEPGTGAPETTKPEPEDPSAGSVPEELPDVPDTPVDKMSLLEGQAYADRLLWGKKTLHSYDDLISVESFVRTAKYADFSTANGMLNLSAVPYGVEVRADEHPDLIRLYFYDKLGTAFILQGSFSLKDPGTLTVSPCEKVFEDAVPLAETITYVIALNKGSISLRQPDGSAAGSYRSESAILQGAADSPAYHEFGAINLPGLDAGQTCTLFFADGGATKDAKVDTTYPSTASVYLKWTKEQHPYNGVMSEFNVSKGCVFNYINTYPYGFLLIDNNDVYFYQQPLPTEGQ